MNKSEDPNKPIDPAHAERIFQFSRSQPIGLESENAEIFIRVGGKTLHLFDINIKNVIFLIRKFF